MSKPFLIIVAGGSASGKSTVVASILKKSNSDDILDINQDDYYKDQRDIPMEQRILVNYDHPESIDNDVLYQDLLSLLKGEIIKKPTYDYVNHTRSEVYERIAPKKVIILEGILSLTDERLRNLADIKVFVESDDDTRFIRRLKRDLVERGRSLDSIIHQYVTTVKPMHHKFVKPTKRYADIIIPNDEKHQVAVDVIVGRIKQITGEKL